jgi:hypothetical protein
MRDFNFYAPTEIVFGKESEEKTGKLVRQYGGKKVLVHYGGQSARRSGLLDKLLGILRDEKIPYVELGGVVPNPRLSLVKRGVQLCRDEKVDFILAVGGGSVIDSAKAIAYGVDYDGEPWDFWTAKATPKSALPIGAVLTIPAAGSEMSNSCVITNDDNNDKRGFNNNLCRCRFCVMNPERTFTLPAYQTAAGATDIMMHTMERYFTAVDDMTLTDSLAEALIRTVKDSAIEVLRNPEDYRNRAQIMWAGSLSHNDLMECGTCKDFATHKLEHELSAMFDVTHGAGLAAIWGSWARYVLPGHEERFARFAVNVMGVENDFTSPLRTAEKGIEAMEVFYRQIGMPTSIRELLGREITDEEILEMARRASHDGQLILGSIRLLKQDDMVAIYTMAKG